MQSKTYSQRPDSEGVRTNISVEPSVNLHDILVTVGPHGGPYQTVYLSAEQAFMLGASFIQMADEVQGQPGTHFIDKH